jgi:hypothetical protein
VLKKRTRISRAVVDVPADEPVGTMDRFALGLKRVLAAPKALKRHKRRASKRHGVMP